MEQRLACLNDIENNTARSVEKAGQYQAKCAAHALVDITIEEQIKQRNSFGTRQRLDSSNEINKGY